MSDKPITGFIAPVGGAAIAMLCCLAPILLLWVVASVWVWLGAFGPVVATGLAIVTAILVYGVVRRRRARSATCKDGDFRPSPVSERTGDGF